MSFEFKDKELEIKLGDRDWWIVLKTMRRDEATGE